MTGLAVKQPTILSNKSTENIYMAFEYKAAVRGIPRDVRVDNEFRKGGNRMLKIFRDEIKKK